MQYSDDYGAHMDRLFSRYSNYACTGTFIYNITYPALSALGSCQTDHRMNTDRNANAFAYLSLPDTSFLFHSDFHPCVVVHILLLIPYLYLYVILVLTATLILVLNPGLLLLFV